MRNFFINAALAVAMAVTALPVLSGPSSAQEMRQHGRPDYRSHRPQRPQRGCNEMQATRKAEGMGLRRARVLASNPRVIKVRGRARNGNNVVVTFGRDRGCPVYR
ncbi:hypothetical protein GA830_06940 [Mesorhizobium sp. NBSH29]|uniref:hypothetical protein n=1 Tax=Mesorhizobium sp. NBSH29 TaxID=2654249 RepID=UPI0018967CB3|nr:hypothetical protein [Mesorhizobium sp. NBSH29]QPC86497.1 hypothetical protein GA830_06940 [Mesorhizobium sp. NBSH29]